MDISIVPIMVNAGGELSFYVAPVEDASKMGLPSFSAPQVPADKPLLDALAKYDLFAPHAKLRPAVKVLAHPSATTTFVVVAGGERVFYSPETASKGRWVSQDQVKYGPLPEQTSARDLKPLFTETLSKDDRMAILAATHAVRSLRAGVSYPGEQSFAIPAWEFAAENPPVMSELMSSMIDGGLPPLAKPDANVAAPVWGRYMRLIAQKAKAATQTVAAQQAEAQPDGAAARKRRATQAATDAKTAAEGKGPKPA